MNTNASLDTTPKLIASLPYFIEIYTTNFSCNSNNKD